MRDKKGIKKYTHEITVHLFNRDAKIHGRVVRAGSILLQDRYYNSFSSGCDLYICDSLPRFYKGNNPRLRVSVWTDGGFWESDLIQNGISRIIWRKFVECGRRKTKADPLSLTDDQARDLMKHERRKKNGGGGSRISTSEINGSLAFRQVTELAYWENLYNARSGNASVVAANIRW